MGVAQAIRRDGSAALDLCYLAAGRIDGFWEERLNAWDMAAGNLMVEEAGGRVSRYDGSPLALRHDEIVASNGALHEAMLGVVRADQAAPRRGCQRSLYLTAGVSPSGRIAPTDTSFRRHDIYK